MPADSPTTTEMQHHNSPLTVANETVNGIVVTVNGSQKPSTINTGPLTVAKTVNGIFTTVNGQL
jgi:hypothetical protein